ncbi:MAG TPA: type II toxin-antitoxin system RelE/ParE family toxin [Pseudolabrys sp.]|nr:type II toxin-antitoxin system RelE/ParE family toxin [Pseudolabrys sp.]
MKIVFTAAARNDLRDIGEWLTLHYPAVAPHVERRIRNIVARIGRWPESGPPSAGREDVRVVPLGRYPYKIFYRVSGGNVEILHIHHAAREP